MHACGAADINRKMYGDDDRNEAISISLFIWVTFVLSDDVLFRRLDDRLLLSIVYS